MPDSPAEQLDAYLAEHDRPRTAADRAAREAMREDEPVPIRGGAALFLVIGAVVVAIVLGLPMLAR